jgi:hypothetical protein
VFDLCGVCAGDGSACEDCAGVPNGDAEEDVCGTCDDDGDGWCNNGDPYPECSYDNSNDPGVYPSEIDVNPYDECGNCHGDGFAELCLGSADCEDMDCNTDCVGTAEIDDCGVCTLGTTGVAFNLDLDCNNDCFGTATYDSCNICSGGNSEHEANSDLDCAGECFGDAQLYIFYSDNDGDGLGFGNPIENIKLSITKAFSCTI